MNNNSGGFPVWGGSGLVVDVVWEVVFEKIKSGTDEGRTTGETGGTDEL